jgi:hypothetical protein
VAALWVGLCIIEQEVNGVAAAAATPAACNAATMTQEPQLRASKDNTGLWQDAESGHDCRKGFALAARSLCAAARAFIALGGQGACLPATTEEQQQQQQSRQQRSQP